MISEGRKPAWMLALRGQDIVLYRHFYRRKTSAFAGAGDGLVLRGGYSSASIVNDRRGLQQHFCHLRPPSRTLEASRPRLADGLIGQRAGPQGAVRSLLSNTNLRGVGDPGHWFTTPRCVALCDGQQTSEFVQRASEMRCTTSASNSWASFSRIKCAE